jgi:hypothetical protein
MYRIELSPGEETAFRSIEELAVAIRRGIVTPRARIWHNASGKWLPIEFHPHYKIAAAMELTPADLVAGAPVKRLELLTLGELMDPPAPPVRQAPPPPPQHQPVKRISKPQPAPRKTQEKSPRRKRQSGRSMRIALAGTLLIGCAHLVITAASAAFSKEDVASVPRTHRHLVRTLTSGTSQGAPETTAAAVLPGLPTLTPALRSSSAPASPQLGAFPSDSNSGIQPAPDTGEIVAPVPPSGQSLSGKVVDSTSKKALNRILRSITTTPVQEQTRPRR